MAEPPIRQHKVYTLILPVDPGDGTAGNPPTVVLGMKKRGFGVGKANGYGGKLEPDDPSLHASALRELKEESLLEPLSSTSSSTSPPPPPPLIPIGILFLESIAPITPPGPSESTPSASTTTPPQAPGPQTTPTPTPLPTPSQILQIHITIAPLPSYTPPAIPLETEEMRPSRYAIGTGIPTDLLWEESRLWLPRTLGEVVSGGGGGGLSTPYFFTHYTRYRGGVSPNTGRWDVWEGLLPPSTTTTTTIAHTPSTPPNGYDTNHAIHISPHVSRSLWPKGWEGWGLLGGTLGGTGADDDEQQHREEEGRRLEFALGWLEGRRRGEFGGGGGCGGCGEGEGCV
ncbi:hypothetical protein DFH27DRAFT_608469 [Peziza echinospora]|nr:hypothetical protein DFH27DRAFT_608469 [Peziza echinospora]